MYTYTLQADHSYAGGIPEGPYKLHDSVVDKLDPVYKEFYAKNLANNSNLLYTHRTPLDKLRSSGNVIPGQTKLADLKEIYDISIPRKYTTGPAIPARVFVPKSQPPQTGFPCYIWYHGGGHVLGGINTENSYCSHMADDAHCIVVSVDYRLAPENPFPAASDDAFEALLWALEGPTQVNINPQKVSVGGSSAGGNLAAVVCQKYVNSEMAQKLPSVKLQILVVPVTDCTATPHTHESWKQFEFTPQLPAEKMFWYRDLYLPDKKSRENPEASPIFYSDESFAKNPPAIVCVGECDILKSEGLAYGEKLRKNGVECISYVYKGCPHPVMVMDDVLEQGKELLRNNADALKKSFL